MSAAALATLFLRTEVEEPLRVAAGTLMFAAIYVGIGAAVGSVVRDPVNGTVVILLIWILESSWAGAHLPRPGGAHQVDARAFPTLWMVDLPSGHGGYPGDLGLALLGGRRVARRRVAVGPRTGPSAVPS